MTLESLLLSRDVELIRVMRPTLEKLAIEVEICQEARKATDILVSDKFDAVIIDCDDVQGGLEVLQGLRATPGNKNSVVFALLNGKRTTTQQAFDMGANFVLQKPISVLNASRCLNAALNFMLRERRRYFRQPVKMMVTIAIEDQEVRATSTNVSEGGIAVLLRQALPKNAKPQLKFILPGTDTSLSLESEVAWIDIKGSVGFRFRNLPERAQQTLESWLEAQMPADIAAIGDAKHPVELLPSHQ